MLGFRSDRGDVLGVMWILVAILGVKWNSDDNFRVLGETYPNKIYLDMWTYLGLGMSIKK
jgi:hypothetical protein